MKTKYVNFGRAGNEKYYRIAEIDEFSHPLVWYKGYYDGISGFELYPDMIVVPGAVKNVRKWVSVFDVKARMNTGRKE